MDNGQKVATLIAIIVSVIILCGGAGFAGYSYNIIKNPSIAQENNYDSGFNIGKEVGYQTGFKAAMDTVQKQTEIKLHNPTYKEMKDFLAQDPTNKLPYKSNERICTDFAAEVNNNAKKLGINCAIVYILYGETGHSIVAFQTTDRGLIFIEPQFDDEVSLIIGKSYSQVNKYIKQDIQDDIVVRYLIGW
jgi:hypothetical protein